LGPVSARPFDATEFRDVQRTQWDVAAPGWRRWSDVIDAAAGAISERLVEMANIEAGAKVLDIAAGYGEPSLTAARKAGPEGLVIATDLSPRMIEFGRQRAAAAAASNIRFVEREAAVLQFPENSFDAALSRWGIIFEPDAEGASRRVRRFVKPGGRFAISSWGPPERVPLIALPMLTAMRRLQVPPPAPGTPGPLSRPTPEALAGLLEGAGFSDVRVEEAIVTYEFESPEQFVAFSKDVAPQVSGLIAAHADHDPDEIWGAIAQAVDEAVAGARPVTLHNLALLASGRA
jgi:ubiquinone/menaquinone biosynthesis C-methylase UbiE